MEDYQHLTEVFMSLDLTGFITAINKTKYSIRIHFNLPEKKTSLVVKQNSVRKFPATHQFIYFTFEKLSRGQTIKVPLDSIEFKFSEDKEEQIRMKNDYVCWKRINYDEQYYEKLQNRGNQEKSDCDDSSVPESWVDVVKGKSWADQISDEEKEKINLCKIKLGVCEDEKEFEREIVNRKLIGTIGKKIFEINELITDSKIEFHYKVKYKGKVIMNSFE